MNSVLVTIKLRLRDKHSGELNRQAAAVNEVWNYCNKTSRFAWQRDRKWLSRFEFQSLTAGSSKELDVHAHTIQRVCHQFTVSRDLRKRAGLRWRGGKSLGWVPFNKGHVSFDGNTLCFRGVKYQPMHTHPLLAAGLVFGAGSFNQDNLGRWYINLPVQVECQHAPKQSQIGIDLGLKDLAAMSDGTKVLAPSFYRKNEASIAAAQRANKTKRVGAIHRKAANQRKDFLHKAANAVSKKYGFIVVGDVSPSRLVKTKMAKSINDAGWADFKSMILYKAVMHGGIMIEVSEKYSSQTCSHCGLMPRGRPQGIAGLGIREWTCYECGSIHDRDVNAARNILRVGLDTLVEGAAL